MFGERVIEFVKLLPDDCVNDALVKQIIRSGTCVGTKRDVKYKIDLCRKEAKKTKHWLRMTAKANPKEKDAIRLLWQESTN